jgi:hypothetical protein
MRLYVFVSNEQCLKCIPMQMVLRNSDHCTLPRFSDVSSAIGTRGMHYKHVSFETKQNTGAFDGYSTLFLHTILAFEHVKSGSVLHWLLTAHYSSNEPFQKAPLSYSNSLSSISLKDDLGLTENKV